MGLAPPRMPERPRPRRPWHGVCDTRPPGEHPRLRRVGRRPHRLADARRLHRRTADHPRHRDRVPLDRRARSTQRRARSRQQSVRPLPRPSSPPLRRPPAQHPGCVW